MTEPRWRVETLPAKAARARRLTDPLGAWGFRRPRARIERERRLREAVLAALVALYLAIVGALYVNQPAHPPATAGTSEARTVRIERTTVNAHTTTRES
jgi:uncharacterized membrane protein